MYFPPQSGPPFDPMAGPQGPAVTWLDRLASRWPGDQAYWQSLDQGMAADPMRALLDAYGPQAAIVAQLLTNEELSRVSPGGQVTRTPWPPSLAQFFNTPVLPPPRY